MKSETKVITSEVRASYAFIFAPIMNEMSGKEEFSITLLVPKTDTELVNQLRAAANFAAKEKWGGKVPQGLRDPLRDADAEAEEKGRPPAEGYAGHFFVKGKTYRTPTIIDTSKKPITDPKAFGSGDYCRASITASAYDKAGNRGVSFWLNAIQVTRRGEPLGRRDEDDFEAFGPSTNDDDCPFD